MLRLLYCAILVMAAALLACSSPTPTPDPTATPVPTPTAPPPAMPTATPTPTATPIPPQPTIAPAPTAVPDPTAPAGMVAPSGALAPIDPSDPQVFLAALPANEQACLAANSDPMRLMTLAGMPGAAINSPQEVVAAVDCLSDDTLLRIFVSGMLTGIGPLSPESSDCLRAGFADYDLRSAMQPGANQGAAAAGDMAAFFLTLSCINDAEWLAAAPVLELNPGDRETLQCVIDTLGGPTELAAALEPDANGAPAPAYLTAAAQCGMNLTPESPATAGMLAPIDPNNPQAFLAALPASEQSCLAANSDPLRLLTLAGMPGPTIAAPQEAAALIDCLGDDTLMRVFLSGMLTGIGPLSQDTADCIRAGFASLDLRATMLAGAAESNPSAAMAGSMAAMFLSLSCLNEAEWQAATPALELNPNDHKILQCLRETLGGPAELAAALAPNADGLPSPAYLDAAAKCGVASGAAPG